MKILVISDTDSISYNFHKNLLKYGYDSILLTQNSNSKDRTVINISNLRFKRFIWFKNALRSFFYRYILLRIKGYGFYQDISENSNYYSLKRIQNKIKFKPDLIIILFDYRILTTKTIGDIYKWSSAKIIWILVDMKPLTGGCSYSGDCLKYITDCNDCPAIGNSLYKNFAKKTLNKKICNLKDIDLTIITNSTYQKNQVKSSFLFKKLSVHHIFLPIDGNIFYYKEKKLARKIIGLPENNKVILFGAVNFNDARKGVNYLIDALYKLKKIYTKEDLNLLIVGGGDIEIFNDIGFNIVKLGFVNYEKLALAYQASDLFVCSTIEDSGPIMVPQSLMSGTPVVAFEMGISIDLVKDGKTGFLAKLKDSTSLSVGISKILLQTEIEKENMRNECLSLSSELGFPAFFKKI
jgi:glycosyltransferase involved in cell wall biosynthesis